MKDLEITIRKEGNYYRMGISCQYSEEAKGIVMSYFGCCNYDSKSINTVLLTTSPFTLMEAQSFLLSQI